MIKYPRTYHFSFSPEIKSDDKTIPFSELGNFLHKEYVILEKMDGQNNCLKGINSSTGEYPGVFARTHSQETKLPWDYLLIAKYHQLKYTLKEDTWYFLENLFGEHSIVYEDLDNYFFLFNLYYSKNNEFLPWDEVVAEASKVGFNTPKELFRGKFNTIGEIKKWMDLHIDEKSSHGSELEGFVMRPVDSFKANKFSNVVAKYVRKGHVQTDEHWTKNWKQAKLKKHI